MDGQLALDGGGRALVRCVDDEVGEGPTPDGGLAFAGPELRLGGSDIPPPRAVRSDPVPRRDAPLVELLGEIQSLQGLRHRGQITAVEYERRRGQVLERI